MTGEPNIDYDALALEAMRGLVRTVLMRAAKSGLPGEHHFYISFDTEAPGVTLSKRLKERYPREMTIVLQHRFWDLIVTDERFEVKLSFDSIPERLVVPFAAIKVFFDPSVQYGLRFEDGDGTGEPIETTQPTSGAATGPRAVPRSAPKKPRRARSPRVTVTTLVAVTSTDSHLVAARPHDAATRNAGPRRHRAATAPLHRHQAHRLRQSGQARQRQRTDPEPRSLPQEISGHGSAFHLVPRREDKALIDEPDADEHRAESDEGERAQRAFQPRHVPQEYLEHGQHDDRR